MSDMDDEDITITREFARKPSLPHPVVKIEEIIQFFEYESKGKTEMPLEEAVNHLETCLHLLKSSQGKGTEDSQQTRDLKCSAAQGQCHERIRLYLEAEQGRNFQNLKKRIVRLVATVATSIVVVGGSVVGLYYRYFILPQEEIKQKTVEIEKLVRDNRKIIYRFGLDLGWEIDPDKPGYRDPLEVSKTKKFGDHKNAEPKSPSP